MNSTQTLTPSQIVEVLDQYIIGQHEAKRNVAIALRNRWRRMQVQGDMQKEILPNNILMIGATGVGKTEIARRLAKLANAPFIKVEASKFTEVGYVGRDVESMVRDLAEQSVKMVKAEMKTALKDKISDAVDEIILDKLIPPIKIKNNTENGTLNQQEHEDQLLNESTREKFREKLKRGEIEHLKIEIDVKGQGLPDVGILGGNIDESNVLNLQEMLGGLMPKADRKRKMPIADARKILTEEEASKLIDQEDLKEEAIRRAENTGIIFIDEIDKIAKSQKNGGGADVSREGVQRDLLPIVEGSAVNTKHGIVNTDHVLFIAAGAFHFAKPSDLIPELQGRFPIRVELQNLSKNDFIRILTEPKNALTHQYASLLATENVQLQFEPEAIERIAEMAFQLNAEIENIGARRLHTVMSQLLNEFLFDIPERLPSAGILNISAELVDAKLQNLVQNRDLSQFIL